MIQALGARHYRQPPIAGGNIVVRRKRYKPTGESGNAPAAPSRKAALPDFSLPHLCAADVGVSEL